MTKKEKIQIDDFAWSFSEFGTLSQDEFSKQAKNYQNRIGKKLLANVK